MKPSLSEWERLLAGARKTPSEAEAQAPFGFSTRVAAQAFAVDQSGAVDVLARFAGPALVMAALVMAVTVATNYQPVLNGIADEVATLSEPIVDAGESSI